MDSSRKEKGGTLRARRPIRQTIRLSCCPKKSNFTSAGLPASTVTSAGLHAELLVPRLEGVLAAGRSIFGRAVASVTAKNWFG